MNNMLILCDTRQQKDEHITKYFDSQKIEWQRATLSSGDYIPIKIKYEKASVDKAVYKCKLYKDFSIIIDTKKNILEIAGNLCNKGEHERIKRELLKARELGCKNFIFLIADSKVTCINDLNNWSSPRTLVKGSTLAQVMKTMQIKYNCWFLFCKKDEMGEKIVKLLNNQKQ